MIGLLKGTLLSSSPERVLLDVGGVGYEVFVPLSTFYEIEKAGANGRVRLFIHTHLRDDGITLYGFWTEPEKRLFEKLIGVGGIGPRLARVILSGMSPADLAAAIGGGDVGRLATIPGVGKKTAERLVVELREAIHKLDLDLPAAAAAAPRDEDDVVLALVNLGYKASQAERAASAARRDLPDAKFHELLRAALKRLARV